jgi:broad specificity phosphatase PhoE
MESKRIYFVRHGETEGNLGKFFQTPEVALTELGIKGAKAVAERLAHLEIDEILASPFLRTQQTAKHIADVLQKEVTTIDEFHEILQPLSVRGKRFDSEECTAHTASYATNYVDPNWKPEGAENVFDVLKRADMCIEVLEKSTSRNIVVITHGAFLRALSAHLLLKRSRHIESLLSLSFSLWTMSNVGITEFMIVDGEWKLFTWNDHAHFAE